MPLPKPTAIPAEPIVKCKTCNHPWAAEWIEQVLMATKVDNQPRPSVSRIIAAMHAYHEEHGAKHKLEAPPGKSSIANHLYDNKHSKAWNGWVKDC